MFISRLTIQNYRLFKDTETFVLDGIEAPDNTNIGSGLNVIVGENGCGKTSILDAIALPLLNYKSESFGLSDLYNPKTKAVIKVYSNKIFDYKGTMPKVSYKGQGFVFEGGIRSKDTKSYLSSVIVSDQKFIKADGESKPIDTSPDLRVAVNNPWSGLRFSENDILYLDKSRTYQVRSGTYSTTRFDRLMEDFDSQYLRIDGNPKECNKTICNVSEGLENQFLAKAIDKFKEISGDTIELSYINDFRPHHKAFFSVKSANNQFVHLDNIGSGYEMIFSLIYSFYLATQSGKQLIILIDEPELHLHPKLQKEFVKLIVDFSKTAQVILTTHSPLLVKQMFEQNEPKIFTLKKENGSLNVAPIMEQKLTYTSSNEINFIAFGLATEEYHNELYEELKSIHGLSQDYKSFDNDYFVVTKGEIKDSPWKGTPNLVSKHTYIRNQIHHQKDNGKVQYEELEKSIIKLRSFF